MLIEDGKGRGYRWEVDSDNHAHVRAYNHSMAHFYAEKGDAFTWTIASYDYAAADTILAVRNDSTTKRLVITDIWLRGDTETDVVIHFPASYTSAGDDIVGIQTNRASGTPADATAHRDETGNTQGDSWKTMRITADLEYHIETHGTVLLGVDNAVAVDFVTDGAECYVTIAGFYEDQ